MFVIRKEQTKVFEEYMVTTFEDQMVKHLKQKYPAKLDNMPEKELRKIIRGGTTTAANYEVKVEDDVRRYLEFMMIYGRDFDISREYHWIGGILRGNYPDGTTKMDLLEEHMRRIQEDIGV